MPGLLLYNGKLFPDSEPMLGATSRGFFYGAGLFETIRSNRDDYPLLPYHLERLKAGMEILGFEIPKSFSSNLLKNEMERLVEANQVGDFGRIRLTVFQGRGTLMDLKEKEPHYLVQAWNLPESYINWNPTGIKLGLYSLFKKAADPLGNLKSNNAILYLLAASHAKENQLDDSLLLNTNNEIIESSIANLFWIKNGQLFTTPLKDGCVAGVFRRYLIEKLDLLQIKVSEISCTREELALADELFLTNALFGIRWVSDFEGRSYRCSLSFSLYREIVSKIFS